MKKKFLEAGKIVNTHGIRGEVKIQAWCDSPEFLKNFSVLYIDDMPVKVISSRAQKDCLIAVLDGVLSVDDAVKLKNKIVYIDRDEAKLEEGTVFVQDLIGLSAIDADTGLELGKITEIINLPANDVYVIKGEREYLIPAVDEFIIEKNIDDGFVKVCLVEGM